MKLRFTGKQQESADVWSYLFVPVEPLAWIPGQSIRLELPRPTYGISERRFTIASAPSEGQVQITTRLSDSRFKQLLDALQSGSEINAYGIEGDFVWQPEPAHKIFVAGGIGITPFRAILQDRPQGRIDLLYGSRDTPAVFAAELGQMSQSLPALHVTHSTDRHLTAADVLALPGWQQALIYLSGPSAMVEALYRQLRTAGVAADHLKADLFTGNISAF